MSAEVPDGVEQSTSKVSPEQVSGSWVPHLFGAEGQEVRGWASQILARLRCLSALRAVRGAAAGAGPGSCPPPAVAAAAAATHGAAAVLIGSCLCRKVPISPIFGSSPSSVPCQASGWSPFKVSGTWAQTWSIAEHFIPGKGCDGLFRYCLRVFAAQASAWLWLQRFCGELGVSPTQASANAFFVCSVLNVLFPWGNEILQAVWSV